MTPSIPDATPAPARGHFASVSREPLDHGASVRANKGWWDAEAVGYYGEHGAFLGDAELVWGPERLTERAARLLGDPAELAGSTVVEIGCGAAQGTRYLHETLGDRARLLATDLSTGMLAQARAIDARSGQAGRDAFPLVACDGASLPLADACVDVLFTAYGVVPFVADSAAVMREAVRVLRPGGRFVFSTTHPIRWAFPDAPGPEGLTASSSYFDRSPYVELDDAERPLYAEHHRTLGDRVREIVAAGLTLVDLVEPEWPDGHDETWGGWSPLRGRLLPGTAIFVCRKPGAPPARQA